MANQLQALEQDTVQKLMDTLQALPQARADMPVETEDRAGRHFLDLARA